MARRLIERRTIVVILSLLVLASGTPQVLARDAAQDARVAQTLTARQQRTSPDPVQSIGVPPDDEPYRTMTLPTASGANPPYPANHTLDAIPPEIVGTPPANHGVESPGYAVGLPPSNHDLETDPVPTGTPPSNHDFATGDLSGWTTTGTVSIQSDATHGSYAQLNSGATLTTSAFTIDASTQTLAVELGFLSTSGIDRVKIAVLSGTGYTTVTEIGDFNCSGCASWVTRSMNASPWLGQSVKLRISAVAGLTGLDRARTEVSFPDYTLSGTVSPTVETDGNTFARLEKNGVLTTAAFTVDSSAQFLAIKTLDQSAQGGQFFLYVLSGPAYATETKVHTNTNVPDSWTKISVNTSAWQGQSIKLQVRWQAAAFGVDDLGTQSVEIPDWQVESDAWLEPTTIAGDSGFVLSTDGDLTSQPFTIDASAQHLTLDYQSAINSIFYVKLLRGATFDQVVDLHGGSVTGTANWQTLKLGIQLYAGETVKLKIEQYWGRGRYDHLGQQEIVLPGWTLATTQAVTTGEDEHGSWVQAFDRSAAYLVSGEIATGIIDGVGSDLRYYAIAYDIGYRPAEMVRITWHDRLSGQSWQVFTDAANDPTGYRMRYFPLYDFMGTDGSFEVQIPDVGKVYSIADNIARQHLNEPFSESVGSQIDTSTGLFGYQAEDLSVQGILPLIFTRYYAAHSDQAGVLGYRWTHSYDTRLVFGEGQDVGVVLGSGRELFYDWYIVFTDPPNRYVPVDPRVHDTLVKNADGSYTFTTTSNLVYDFDAAGTLLTISDPNGNSVTLTYDTGGRLTTVADPVGRELDLVYDTNGRLATVTDPVGAVVSYGYDANGDLVSVTDPLNHTWTYVYDRHRLVEVTGPDAVTQFTNTLDDRNRVVTQTLADDATLTIAYATPAKGVTSVTDPEGNTAEFYFDRHARTTHKVDPLNQTTEYQYDADGNRVRVIDPANNQWNFAYDGAGNLTTFTDATGNPLGITYTGEHLPTTITDACGNQTTLTYDADGNLDSLTNALNQTTSYTYNSRGQVLTETNPLNQTTTYTYDTQGNRITMTNPLGHTWSWTYDPVGRMLTETDPLNHTTTLQYNLTGHITSIEYADGTAITAFYDLYGYLLWHENQFGQRTNWVYDDRGFVSSRIDRLGKSWSYTYDDNGNMLTETDPLGHTTSYTYDANNRVIAISNALNETTTYAYDAAGRLTSQADPLNRVTSFGYDAANRLVSSTMPNGGVITSSYDACGNLLSTTNALNHTTSYTYDQANRKSSTTDPRGKVWTFTYDAAGRISTEENPLGGVMAYTYDAAGQLASVTDPLSRTSAFVYDAAGNRTSVIDPLNHTTTTAYDSLNRVLSDTNSMNQTTTFSYDLTGRLTRETLPSGAYTDYTYDQLGRVLTVADRLGNTTTSEYDDAGRLTSETDPNNRSTSYAYDEANRLTSMTDALNGVVTYAYDDAGQVASLTNPRGKTWSYTFNGLGQILTETDPLSRVTTHTYDLAGRPTSRTDARNISVGYAYNSTSQLTSISFPGGSIVNNYDDLGRRTSMTDDTGTTTWAYDAASQVTSVAAPNGTVSYTYDNLGRRTSMTQPGNRTVTYGYDAVSRLTSLTDWMSRIFTFGYNADGQRTNIARPGDVLSTYGYDLAGRLTNILHTEHGTTIDSFNYTLDAAGNRTAVTGTRGTETYTLDALNRITAVMYANGDTASYSYDANGNRLTETANGATTNYTYDDADQLTSVGGTTYVFDANGNLTAAGADTFAWDWTNQLTSATVNGATTTFEYDGDGGRSSQTAGGTTTNYVYDQQSGLPLVIDDGTTQYLHAGGLIEHTTGAGVGSYSLADGLGSVRSTTSTAGVVNGSANYDVFGQLRSSTGTPGTFGFGGEQTDGSTGLNFQRARYMDPSLGRFLSADSVQPNAPGTQGYNRYAYVANNPTSWTDPSGHSTLIDEVIETVTDGVPRVLREALKAVEKAEREGGPLTQTQKRNVLIRGLVNLFTPVIAAFMRLLTLCLAFPLVCLVIVVTILMIAMVMLWVIGQALAELADPIDHGPRPGEEQLPLPLPDLEQDPPDIPAPPATPMPKKDECESRPSNGPYSDLDGTDRVVIGKFRDFTERQKRRIYDENERRNGGVLESDLTGLPLVRSLPDQTGVTPPDDASHVDHICPRSRGGTNAYSNAMVLSRAENMAKGDTLPGLPKNLSQKA